MTITVAPALAVSHYEQQIHFHNKTIFRRHIVKIQQAVNGSWTSRWTFIFAATGSAVGLGNIWKFPYIMGENGGGAFILVYLVCIALIGIPVMMAEVLVGYRSRMSPINAMHYLAEDSGASRHWALVGCLGLLAGLLILSFYSVVAGWSIHYLLLAATGSFTGIDSQFSGECIVLKPKELL